MICRCPNCAAAIEYYDGETEIACLDCGEMFLAPEGIAMEEEDR